MWLFRHWLIFFHWKDIVCNLFLVCINFLRAGITQQFDAFVCVFCPLIIHVNYDTMLIHGLLFSLDSVNPPEGIASSVLAAVIEDFPGHCLPTVISLKTQLGGIVDSAPSQLPWAIFKLTGEGIEPTSHEVSVAKSSVWTASSASLQGRLQLGWDLE